jgi:hypothetical protein
LLANGRRLRQPIGSCTVLAPGLPKLPASTLPQVGNCTLAPVAVIRRSEVELFLTTSRLKS